MHINPESGGERAGGWLGEILIVTPSDGARGGGQGRAQIEI